MYKSWLLLFGLLFALAFSAKAQNETFEKEITYGLNWNTNGGLLGGASLRFSRTIDEKWQQFYGLEIVEVKHPKENPLPGQSGNGFIWGKTNYLYVVRPEYGREFSLFKKAPENGVEVNAVIGVGPSFGLQVPYYIIYDRSDYVESPPGSGYLYRVGPAVYRTERYDPMGAHKTNIEFIRGNAGFLTGFGEMNVNIGAHIRTALSFEYGRYPESITGIETGFMVEAYPKTIVMVPEAENYKVFTSVFLTLFYGRRK